LLWAAFIYGGGFACGAFNYGVFLIYMRLSFMAAVFACGAF
jgi:hypothetical protein